MWNKKRRHQAAQIQIKGHDQYVSKVLNKLDEEIKLYDLAALYQHGPNMLINAAKKLSEYLEKLMGVETQACMESFLNGPGIVMKDEYISWCCVSQALLLEGQHLCGWNIDLVISLEHLCPSYWHWALLSTKGLRTMPCLWAWGL